LKGYIRYLLAVSRQGVHGSPNNYARDYHEQSALEHISLRCDESG
jgi:hypothetical protein